MLKRNDARYGGRTTDGREFIELGSYREDNKFIKTISTWVSDPGVTKAGTRDTWAHNGYAGMGMVTM